MKITGILLKKAANGGLTLNQIGSILCRPDEDDSLESPLEKIVSQASRCANMTRSLLKKKKQLTNSANRNKFDPFKCIAFKNSTIVMFQHLDTDSEDESPMPKLSSPRDNDASFSSVFFTSDDESPREELIIQSNSVTKKNLRVKAEQVAKRLLKKFPVGAHFFSKKHINGPHDREFFMAFEMLLEETIEVMKVKEL